MMVKYGDKYFKVRHKNGTKGLLRPRTQYYETSSKLLHARLVNYSELKHEANKNRMIFALKGPSHLNISFEPR